MQRLRTIYSSIEVASKKYERATASVIGGLTYSGIVRSSEEMPGFDETLDQTLLKAASALAEELPC